MNTPKAKRCDRNLRTVTAYIYFLWLLLVLNNFRGFLANAYSIHCR